MHVKRNHNRNNELNEERKKTVLVLADGQIENHHIYVVDGQIKNHHLLV